MKNVRLALLVFSGFLAIGAVILLLWTAWPVNAITSTTRLHLIPVEGWGNANTSQLTAYTFDLNLTQPESMKTGQVGTYHAELIGLPPMVMINGVSYKLRVRSELVMTGFDNQQEGMIIQSVQAGEPLHYQWNVRAIQPINSHGVLRIYADYISPSQTVISQLISISDLELTSKSLAGLSTTGASSLAVALVLLAGMAGGLGFTRIKTE